VFFFKDQIDVLVGQREVTASQPINQNQALGDWPFFSFDKIFFYWELYAQAVNELMATIVSGVVAVAVVTYVLIPHWSAIFFVGPGIIILYIDFLGKFGPCFRRCGVPFLNALTHELTRIAKFSADT